MMLERAMKIANNPEGLMLMLHDRAKRAQGNILEIGTWRGGSALMFMDAMASLRSKHMLVTVDPWGVRPYPGSQSRYNDDDQRAAMFTLAQEAVDRGINWHHFKMTSLEFLDYAKFAVCWYRTQRISYKWALAFLDGEHVFDTVKQEVVMLAAQMLPGSTILIDNANHRQPEGSLVSMQSQIAELAMHLDMTCMFYFFQDDVVAELTTPGE